MYRNSAQIKCIPTQSPPTPDNTSDSESDIVDALDRKRRQLDEEITKFKAAKDREFREFEKDLRIKRKGTRTGTHSNASELPPGKNNTSSTSSSTAAVLNLLASAQNTSATNGWLGYKSKRGGDGAAADKIIKPAPSSKPSLSLDKLNISGKTAPALNNLGTPPTPSLLDRSTSRSPSNSSTTVTPQSLSEKIPPPTPLSDRFDPFAGVFTPAYLPLLESRDHTPLVRSPQPMNVQDEGKKRLQLDSEAKKEAEKQLKQQIESSQSLPQQAVSPTILAAKRAKSTSVLPSTSLPSALRSSSGGGRTRKHVTFQLADLKVVEPSSSYEEGPSPKAIEQEKDRFGGDGKQPSQQSEKTDAEEGVRRSMGSPRLLGEKERRRGRSGRFASPIPSPQPSPSPSPSPTINGTSNSTLNSDSPALPSPALLSSPDESGFSGGLSGAEDGGSGVGFFELDEELASPALREGKVPTFDLEVDSGGLESVDFNDKMEMDGEIKTGSFKSGSVPINIVRPTGSWVGSFGH